MNTILQKILIDKESRSSEAVQDAAVATDAYLAWSQE
jgi:hypothetical protein